MGAYLLHIYKGSPACCEKVELETLRSHLNVAPGVCDARILAPVEERQLLQRGLC